MDKSINIDDLLVSSNGGAASDFILIESLVNIHIKGLIGMINSPLFKNSDPMICEETLRALARYNLLLISISSAKQLANNP